MRPAAVLSVVVTANSSPAVAQLRALDAQLATTGRRANTFGTRFAAGMRMAGLGGAAALGFAAKAAADFEQAFADVRKTVDTNEAGFARIEKGLRGLSKRIPESSSNLAELAGEAGALGIAAEDIVSFTKTASQLGTTTNLSAETASNALARIVNIMDTKGGKAFQRMGSVLVDLGNKGASTEDEIAGMAMRIAGAGEVLNLTEAQVFGLAASLANVGIRAEMGGSAISRVMFEIQDAVAQGGKELKAFADIAGMSAGQFERQFGKSAPAAIAMFADGLGKVKDSGDSVIQTLDSVQLNEIRVRDTLLRIAGNTGQFVDAQATANKAWKDNNALTEEAEKRYATFLSQLSLLKNTVIDAAVGLGQRMLPALKSVVSILRDPNMDFGEKFGQITEMVTRGVVNALPKFVEFGAQAASSMVRGFLGAWWNADLFGKLLLGGGAFALLSKTFGGLGTSLAGVASGVGGLAGAFAMAARSGALLSTVGAGLALAFRAHPLLTLGAGIGVAVTAVQGLSGAIGGLFNKEKQLSPEQQRLKETSDRLASSLRRQRNVIDALDASSAAVRRSRRRERDATEEVRLAEQRHERARRRYISGKGSYEDLIDSELRLARAKQRQARATEAAKEAEKVHGVTRKLTKPILAQSYEAAKQRIISLKNERDRIDDVKERLVRYGGTTEQITKALKDGQRVERQLTEARGEQARVLRQATTKIGVGYAKRLRENKERVADLSTVEGRLTQRLKDQIPAFDSVGDRFRETTERTEALKNAAKRLNRNGSTSMSSFRKATGRSMGSVSDYVQDAFGSMGLNNPPGTFGLSVPGNQKGAIVPGVGVGDKVPLHVAGQHVANVEPGEKVAVVNRKAAAREMALNKTIPRFQGGGVVEALGPHAVAPFQYDAGHDKPQSHWHIGFGSPAQAVAFGHRFQRMGFSVSQHPAFGGFFMRSYPSLHHSGRAIDVNSAADETLAETKQVARVLGGGAVAELVRALKAPQITGPDGALREIGQGASDLVTRAANKYVRQQAPQEGFEGADMAAGSLSRQQVRRLLRTAGLPDIMGYVAAAESQLDPGASNPSGASGLWQIMMPLHAALVNRLGGSVFDPLTNARAAKALYNESGLVPWEESRLKGAGGGWGQHLGKKFQEGGIIGLDAGRRMSDYRERPVAMSKRIKQVLFGGKKPPRKKRSKSLLKGIKSRFGLSAKLNEQLASLSRQAALAQEAAGFAAQLDGDNPYSLAQLVSGGYEIRDDEENVLGSFAKEQLDQAYAQYAELSGKFLGVYRGKNEEQWTTDELNALWPLRNRLIKAIGVLKRDEARSAKLMAVWQKKAKELRKRVKKNEELKEGLEKKLARATKAHDDAVRSWQKKKKKDRTDDPRQDPRVKKTGKDVRQFSHRLDQVTGELRLDKPRLNALTKDRGVISTIRDERDSARQRRTDLIGDLEGVHGLTGPKGRMKTMPKWPPYIFGGDIFAAQSRLAELRARPTVIKDVAEDTTEEPFQGLDVEGLQRFAETLRLGAFSRDAFGGFFAQGGLLGAGKWGIAGENGPEPIVGPARVVANDGFGPPVVNLTLIAEEGAGVDLSKMRVVADQAVQVNLDQRDRESRQAARTVR